MNVGIIGSGVAGLHLALLLQKHGARVTVYTDKNAAQLERTPLSNTVVHHHHTRVRERALGVNHWDRPGFGSFCHHHYFGGERPLQLRGDFSEPGIGVDYRIYLSRLLRDFEERGGAVVIRALTPGAVDRLSASHDVMVVATGLAGLAEMFPREPEYCPHDRPQRLLCAGLWHGVSYPEPMGVTISVSPGHGELIEIPLLSFEGPTTALLFECIPGGDHEALTHVKYGSSPKRFERLTLNAIEEHHPTVRERVNEREFGLLRPLDLLQGGVTPCVRSPSVPLSTGKLAIAIGDARVALDPLTGQGGNVASYTAWALGEVLLEGTPPGRELCDELERRTRDFILGAAEWTNLMLAPPPAHVLDLFEAMAKTKALADEVTDHFNRPNILRDIFATPEATAALIEKYGAGRAHA